MDTVLRYIMSDDEANVKKAKKFLESHHNDVRSYLNAATLSSTDQIGVLPKKLMRYKIHPVSVRFASKLAGGSKARRVKLRAAFGKEIAKIHRTRINKRVDNCKKAITSVEVTPLFRPRLRKSCNTRALPNPAGK
jgi:hypothetical protein